MSEITNQHVDAYVGGKIELVDLLGVDADTLDKLRGRAQFFLDGGHRERALIMLEMLEELDRRDKLPTLLAIEVLLELGRSDAARDKIDALLARDAHDPDALVALAELRLATGELVAAANLLRTVIEVDPDAKTSAGARAQAVAARAHARLSRQNHRG
ncbi:MAG: tetratricopeptide repeat protein [Myxococcota bacterium]